MKKAILPVLIFVTMFFGNMVSAFASEGETTRVSLDEAITHALANSPSVSIAERKIERDEVAMEEAEYNMRQEIKNQKKPYYYSTIQNVPIRKGYYTETAKRNLEMSKINLEQTRKKIEYDVTSAYYTLKNAQQSHRIAKDAYQLASENYRKTQVRLEVGVATQTDVLTAKNYMDSSQYSVDKAERTANLAFLQFCNATYYDAEGSYQLTDKLDESGFTTPDLEEGIKAGLENRTEITTVKNKRDLDALYLECVSALYLPNTFMYRKADLQAKESALSVTDTENSIRLGITKDYYDLLSSYDNIAVQKGQQELTKKQYSDILAKEEVGMATSAEVTDSLNKSAQAELSYTQAILTFRMAELKYNSDIGYGLNSASLMGVY